MIYPETDWQPAPPASQGVDDGKLNEAVRFVKSMSGADGLSQALVICNGYLIWHGDDIDNHHIIWSCTKSFMSTCLGLLWDDGKCTPQTLAKDYFPAMAADYPTVTLEHLATFTSGYDHAPNNPYQPAKPLYAPGAALHYSRQSDTLAYVLTMIAREPLNELFRRRIAGPIGMALEWKDAGPINGFTINGGAGMPESGVHTTAREMARFGWLYCNHGQWKGRQLISRRYIEYAGRPRVAASVPPYEQNGWYKVLPGSYGLNWWVKGALWPHAPAGTFAAQGNLNNICFIIPEWNMVIVRLGLDNIVENELYDEMFKILSP
jgi:CubicO group peptidase (beta-lactamase class C family)